MLSIEPLCRTLPQLTIRTVPEALVGQVPPVGYSFMLVEEKYQITSTVNGKWKISR